MANVKLKNENLLQTPPKNFKVAYHKYDPSQRMRFIELIPKSDTLKNWSEMITIIIYHANINFTPSSYVERMKTVWSKACKDSKVIVLDQGNENSYDFTQASFYCPLSTVTHKAEWMYMKVIKGKDSFYIVQRALTHQPDEHDVKAVQVYLKSVKVCDTREKSCGPLPK